MPKEVSKRSLAYLLEILTLLKEEGVDVRKIPIYKKRQSEMISLKEIIQEGINIDGIIKKYNLDPDYPVGLKIHALRQSYNGIGTCRLTEEDREKAENLEIINKFFMLKELIEILTILKKEGVNLTKIVRQKRQDNKRISTTLREINQYGIDMEQIIKKHNLYENYEIGNKIVELRQAYNGNNLCVITEQDRKDIELLGILERKSSIEELIEVLDILKKEGMDIRRIPVNKSVNGKVRATLLKDIKPNNIDMETIIKKYKLDGNYAIGVNLSRLRKFYKRDRSKLSEYEIMRSEELGIIDRKSRIEEVLDILEILKSEGIDINAIKLTDKSDKGVNGYSVLENVKQDGIDIQSIIEKYKFDKKYFIGSRICDLRSKYNKGELTEKDRIRAEKIGIIRLKDLQEEQENLLHKIEEAKRLKRDIESVKKQKSQER